MSDLAVRQLESKLAEYQHLFDLQWTRMQRATELWRAEFPADRALVQPDLGALLDWLIDRGHAAGRAQAANEIAAHCDDRVRAFSEQVAAGVLAEFSRAVAVAWEAAARVARQHAAEPVPSAPDGGTREQILAAATEIHDREGCRCDRKYLMSCSRLAAAILRCGSLPDGGDRDDG